MGKGKDYKPLPKSLPYEDGREDIQLDYIVKHYIPDRKKMNVCDYGCGNGLFLAAISNYPEKSIKYLPIDEYDDALTETGNHMLNNPQLVKPLDSCKPGNLDLNKYGGKFDLVIMHHLLHEVIRPYEVFEQAFKLLKPKGKIFIGDFRFFRWHEPHHIFWDCETIGELFDPEIFEVNCFSHEDRIKGKTHIAFLAEVFLKPGKSYPDRFNLFPRIKNIYIEMLKYYRERIKEFGNWDRKPPAVQTYESLESHITRCLEEFKTVPELRLIQDIEALINNLKDKYSNWQENISYIHQEGKFGSLPPHEFLEVNQLRRLREKQGVLAGDELRPMQDGFEKIGSGPLLETIEKPENQRLVLLGDPGMGKTTTIKYLTYHYAENFKKYKVVPVHVELKYYDREGWLSDEIGSFLKGIEIEELAEHFNIVLLLDGYNEVGSEKLEHLDSEINRILRTGYQIIITSRKATYPESFEGFSTCEIEPLNDAKIKEYLGKVFGEDKTEGVFDDLKTKGLVELARIPLFLGFICELLSGPETLPATKGKLLERVVEIKLKQRAGQLRKCKRQVDLIMKILPEFCYTLATDNRGIVFESDELRDFIADNPDWKNKYGNYETGDVIDCIKEHGFVEDHYEKFSFWHQTIFEYFAARQLKEILEAFSDERVFLETFITHLRDRKRDEILSILFGLVTEDLKEKLLKPFHIGIDSKEFDRISLLIDVSKIARNPGPCIELLKHEDTDVRSSAADALGEIKAKEAVEPLMGLLKDKEVYVRSSAADALGYMKAKEAVEPLTGLLKDKDLYVRSSAANALGYMKAKEAVEPLTGLLKDKDLNVRSSAADALGYMKAKEAVEPLTGLLKDKDLYVRLSAANALGYIKAKEAIEPLKGLLKDKDLYVRSSAANALGKIKAKETVEPLMGLLKDEDLFVRSSAADALGEIKAKETVEPLMGLLKDKDLYVRLSAADALGYIKAKEAVEPLMGLLKDEDSSVRWSAADALGYMKAKEAVEPLMGLLIKDKDSDVRSRAANALGEIKAKEAVEPLMGLLKDKDLFVRSSAALALGDIIDDLSESEKLYNLNKVAGTGLADIDFYQSLKTIRYIPEDFLQSRQT